MTDTKENWNTFISDLDQGESLPPIGLEVRRFSDICNSLNAKTAIRNRPIDGTGGSFCTYIPNDTTHNSRFKIDFVPHTRVPVHSLLAGTVWPK